jgi:hypothetical protein
MSFKMSNWAYTHSLKAGPKLLLVTIADKAHDDGTTPAGLEYLSYETDIPLPTLKRYMRQLREMNLLHTERREYKGFGGRLTNLIVLHPWIEGNKPSWYDYQKLRAEAAVTEQKFGTEVPVENSKPTQGINLIPSSNSGANTQSINPIPCAHKVSNEPTQGINSDNFEGGALKERARGFNHQLINHQSISQSVKSPVPVENSEPIDGQTEIENPKPLEPADSAQVEGSVAASQEYLHRGVDISRVRLNLIHAGIPAAQTTDNQLIFMIDFVLDRATSVVRYPSNFVTTALKNDWYQLVSQAEEKSLNSAGAVCRQHRCYLSVTGECKRCIAEQRAAELDDLHHELVWKKNLTQIDVETLEVSLRHGGYAIDSVSVQDFGQHITAALKSGIAPTNQDLFRYFADNQEIFTHNAASDKELAGFEHERTA